jgi:enoyl-CoA hydratase
MSTFDAVIYEKEDSIAYVTLNRPKVLNAYNIQMRDELYQILGAIKDDMDVLCVIFKGQGEKAFCAGADLTEFLTAPSPNIARRVRFERDVWGLFLSVPQPIIVALHGYVLGDGLEIALYCDIRIASEDAKFGMPELGLGIIPAAGGTQTLPRTVGKAKAFEMLYTGRHINAEEACRTGLVNRVVPRDRLLATANDIAKRIVSYDQKVVRRVKEAVLRGLNMPLTAGLELERRLAKEKL